MRITKNRAIGLALLLSVPAWSANDITYRCVSEKRVNVINFQGEITAKLEDPYGNYDHGGILLLSKRSMEGDIPYLNTCLDKEGSPAECIMTGHTAGGYFAMGPDLVFTQISARGDLGWMAIQIGRCEVYVPYELPEELRKMRELMDDDSGWKCVPDSEGLTCISSKVEQQ